MCKLSCIKPFALTLLLCIIIGVQQMNAQGVKEKTIDKLEKTATDYNQKIDKQTAKYLQKLERQEQKFKRKLQRIDSTAAKQLFAQSQEKYQQLNDKVKNSTGKLQQRITDYLPGLDSTTTALKFITQNPTLQQGKQYVDKAKTALQQYETLQQKLQSATDVKNFIKERKAQLQEAAKKYNLTKHLGKYNKQAYYYAAQLGEYKQALKDPKKAEELVLQALKKIPAFKNFMQRFGIMGNSLNGNTSNVNASNMAGLQSRLQVQQYISQQFGGNNQLINNIQQGFRSGLGQMNNLQNTISNSNYNPEQPDFKPNNCKTKSLKQRIEKGFSINSEKVQSTYVPSLLNIGSFIGYKLNSNIVFGVGIAYKLGVKATNLKSIKLSNETLGYRSYFDIKISKNNFWMSGGYEKNLYFDGSNINQWYTFRAQESLLVGVTKKVQIKTNKGVKIQLLYDAFANKKIPQTSPFIYRISFFK